MRLTDLFNELKTCSVFPNCNCYSRWCPLVSWYPASMAMCGNYMQMVKIVINNNII